MLKKLIFLTVIVFLSNASQIEWPFFAENDDLLLNLSIGTPAQQVKVSLQYFYTRDDLQVLSSEIGGDYNNSASSTWKYYGGASDWAGNLIGASGFESFKLGNFNLKNGSFILRNASFISPAYIGFGPSNDDYTFIKSLIDSFIQKKIFIAFDKFPVNGTITLGSIDKKRCFNDWRDLNMTSWYTSPIAKWGTNLASISVGKTSIPTSGKLVYSIYGGDEMQWPNDVYSKVMKELGSKDGEFIPCNSTTPIIFTIEDRNIHIKPADYLDTGMPDGKCGLAGETSGKSTDFVLPQFFFRDYCMSIDVVKQVVGIATRRPEKAI